MPQDAIWGWCPEEKEWVKLRVDADGSIHVVGYVDELDDIGDVNVPTPTDGYVLYWDETAGKWQDIARLGIIQALTADHTWSGLTAPMTAGTALTIGQAVYVGGDGKMEKARATDATTVPAVALATGTIAEDAVGEFLMQGFFRDDDWTWTPGGLLYVSETTGGALTQTLPAGSGEQVQVVGVAISADIIYFNPSYELVEIS